MDATFPMLAQLGVAVFQFVAEDSQGLEAIVVRVRREEFAAKIAPYRVRSQCEWMPAIQAEKIAYEALKPSR